MTSPIIEVLILDTDAGEIPAILATCRTPLPAARNCFAFSTFGFAIGGLPNLIERARAAACPRNMRSRRDCRRWCARSAETSNSDSPFEVSLSKPSSCKFSATWAERQISMNLIRSTSAFPNSVDGPDQNSVDRSRPDRLYQRDLTGPAILTLLHRCRTVSENVRNHPSTLGCNVPQMLYLLIGRYRAVRAGSGVNCDALHQYQMLSQNLVLASKPSAQLGYNLELYDDKILRFKTWPRFDPSGP